MVAKTVYDTYWKPSPITGLILLVMTGAIIYLPHFMKVPVFITPWVAVTLQLAICIVVTLFFYSGVDRFKQFRITMLMYLCVAAFGVVSNLFYQATFLASPHLLTTDYVIAALMNLGSIALTLSCYRISHNKIEVSSNDEASSINPEQLEPLSPLVYALPVIASIALMYFSRSIPNGTHFAISLPFYICGQLFISLWSSFFFFKDHVRAQKIRLGLAVLSCAMALGATGNLMHHQTSWRPGWRINLYSSEFMIMNGGAIVIVLVYMMWKKSIAEQKAKRAKLLETEATGSKPQDNVKTPVAAAAAPELANTPDAKVASRETIKIEQPQDSKTL
ncbi:MAG: hypothetical protein SGJ27_24925 [Candidatus Melainabacteria bacterium]|nr:hypothetical protein [Candidatus Melainabacteria bacterium]